MRRQEGPLGYGFVLLGAVLIAAVHGAVRGLTEITLAIVVGWCLIVGSSVLYHQRAYRRRRPGR